MIVFHKFTMFSLKLSCAPFRYNKCKTMSFNNKLVVFCGCPYDSLGKIFVYNVDEQRWVNKKTAHKYNFNEAEIQKAPKQ